jgi:hypothetical protein
MRHPLRGLLVGPVVAPFAYWIGITAYAWQHDLLASSSVLRELSMIFAFGLPIAYVAAFVFGAPVLFVLRRLGWLRAWTVIASGAAGGAIVAALLALAQQGAMFQVRMSLPAGAAIGALAGAACWWAGKGKP